VSGQTGFTCIPCDYNNVCPGAKITAESSTAFAACGANKITTTQFAKSDRECVVKPGFGWGTGDTSAACDAGFCECIWGFNLGPSGLHGDSHMQ
jgi:hypothetical protein